MNSVNRRWLAASAAGLAAVCAAIPGAESPCQSGCVPAHYWQVASNDYTNTDAPTFPEKDFVSDRADFGLAFSGGGTRSASITVGALRGLSKNGWLARVRYISAVSGGSWASVPFVYSVLPTTELLGTIDADVNDDAFLNTPNGAIAKAIAKSSFWATGTLEATAIAGKAQKDKVDSLNAKAGVALGGFLQLANHLRRDPDRIDKTYTRLIGKAFIDPVVVPGTATDDLTFSWSDQSLKLANPKAIPLLGFPALAHGGRPYLIASGALVESRSDDDFFPWLVAPVEYTPMYVGVRQTLKFKDADGNDAVLGGGYVESWAYDANESGSWTPKGADSKDPVGDGTVTVSVEASRRFSLADVAASSGAAPQLLTITGGPVPDDYKGYVQDGAQVFPAFKHLSVAAKDETAMEVAHADGGAQDNLGVMPLLARQVKNVLVFINTNNQYWRFNDDLRSLFVWGTADFTGDKRENVVLQATDPGTDALELVLHAFDQASKAEKPLVYCAKNWTVLPNQHYNIRGYKGLNICFFYNDAPAGWRKSLSARAQEQLRKQKNFPWLATFGQNKFHVVELTAVQVNLLTNMWAWIMTDPGVMTQISDSLDTKALRPLP